MLRGHETRRRLAALRLVSKGFCYSASARLFRHIIIEADSSSQKPSPLARLLELSNSPYAVYVRQVDLRFEGTFSTDKSHSLYVEDLAGLLSCCLARFPNLSALEFHGPPSSLPPQEKGVFINTVVAAIRYVPLLNLTELEVNFPITHDFRQLFSSKASTLRIPIEHVLRRLRHLGLHVSEYTSHRGQRYWRRTPVLPENAAFPNEIYAVHLFRLVERAVNLESLSISSMDLLNLDNIQFDRSLRLKSLNLSRVSISSHTILSLVEQCKESIRSIQLWTVELNSGTWQHVLLQMSKLPHLIYFAIESSGYSSTGTSSNLALELLPPPDDPDDIETSNFLDTFALGNLQRQVNANRSAAGFSQFSEYEYRHIQKTTLESMMGEQSLGGQVVT